MSWSPDQKTPSVLVGNTAKAAKPSEHPARSIMSRRWEERRARMSTPDPTVSGVQTLSLRAKAARLTAKAARLTAKRQPPPIPLIALTFRIPYLERGQPSQPVAAHGGRFKSNLQERAQQWLRNPQEALLLVALFGCVSLLSLLFFGGFFG
jgi:hypothetical protein